MTPEKIESIDKLLEVLRKHGVEVFKDESFTIQLSQQLPVVAQSEPLLPSSNPYATLRDIDAAYGIPQINKEDESWS
jgi:hypothetical protein